MNARSIRMAVITALLTACTLGSSIWGFLFLAGPNSITRLDVISSDNTILQLILGLTVYLCGGGLWRLGIARLMNTDAKSMVKACAVSWSATGLTFAIALGLSLGAISKLIKILPNCCHSTHFAFLSIFVPVIGIVAAINGFVAIQTLGWHNLQKSLGLYTGFAAAVGFLAVGLILLYGFGWEVGKPNPGKYAMLLLLLICCIGAALAGGASLGWMLSKAELAKELRMENIKA